MKFILFETGLRTCNSFIWQLYQKTKISVYRLWPLYSSVTWNLVHVNSFIIIDFNKSNRVSKKLKSLKNIQSQGMILIGFDWTFGNFFCESEIRSLWINISNATPTKIISPILQLYSHAISSISLTLHSGMNFSKIIYW